MPDDASTLNPDELLAPLEGVGGLLLAVSGGPDSVALMLLASRWSKRAGRDIAIATVDHALRPESREEAQRVAEWARALGFAHHTLVWEGAKPKTRIQERAREARYGLLASCARKIGAAAVVTAHHADDQVETILFRLARGSGISGLAGMATASRLDGLLLLRPLLGTSKRRLEAYCVKLGQAFLRDPSNENPAFARTRLRRLRTLLEDNGFDARSLLRLAERAARAEAALAWSAARLAESLPAERDAERFAVTAEPLRALPQELLRRILVSEIARIGASAPRLERVERAVEAIAGALASGAPLRITLGGTLISVAEDRLTIEREAPRRAAPGAVNAASQKSREPLLE